MLNYKNVAFKYTNHTLFSNVNFEIKQGDFTFIIGKSGSGKSTLLRLAYFDIFPVEGSVEFLQYSSDTLRSKFIPEVRKKIGIVFQDFRLLKDRNVFDNLNYVLEVTGNKRKDNKTLITEILQEVGLLHKKYAMPNELSGGEMQRVAIARALINKPLLIAADEPTGNLDPETSMEIIEILRKVNKAGTSVLFATHNYELVKKYPADIYKLESGKVLKAIVNKP